MLKNARNSAGISIIKPVDNYFFMLELTSLLFTSILTSHNNACTAQTL